MIFDFLDANPDFPATFAVIGYGFGIVKNFGTGTHTLLVGPQGIGVMQIESSFIVG
jgi:hypothetical protein